MLRSIWIFIVILLMVAFAQEHSHETSNEMTAMTPNVLSIGDNMVKLEPLLDADGSMKIAFSVLSSESMIADMSAAEEGHHDEGEDHADHHDSEDHQHDSDESHSEQSENHDAHDSQEHDASDRHHESANTMLNITITAPDGSAFGAMAISDNLVVTTGNVMAGLYSITGILGADSFSSTIAVYMSVTRMDTSVITFLTPQPSITNRGLTQAFIYAIADGENVHSGMTLNRKMAGMTHMSDDEEISLTHEHFLDKYNSGNFVPMTNIAAVNFMMAGDWDITVTIIGSAPDVSEFTIQVADD